MPLVELLSLSDAEPSIQFLLNFFGVPIDDVQCSEQLKHLKDREVPPSPSDAEFTSLLTQVEQIF
jgi:hypothetical protein